LEAIGWSLDGADRKILVKGHSDPFGSLIDEGEADYGVFSVAPEVDSCSDLRRSYLEFAQQGVGQPDT